MRLSWMMMLSLGCAGCEGPSPPELAKTDAPVEVALPAPTPDADERHAVLVLRFNEKAVELVSTRIGVGAAPGPRGAGSLTLTLLDRKGNELGRTLLDDPRDVRVYGNDPKSTSLDPVVRMSDVEVTLSFPLTAGFEQLAIRDARSKLRTTLIVGESLTKACEEDGSDACRTFSKAE